MARNFDFLNNLFLSKEAIKTISLILEGTVSGRDDIFETPISAARGSKHVLQGWTDIYNANKGTLSEELQSLEASQISKFGPRSIAVPWEERREGVLSYFGEGPNVTLSSYDAPRSVLRPLSLDKAITYMKNSTNSGLPYMVRKRRVKEEAVDNFDKLLTRVDPCMLFTRTQENKKTRSVWGYPIVDTLMELRYFIPLLSYSKKARHRSAVNGPEAVDRAMTDLILTAVKKDEHLVSIDFSAYDSSLKLGLQKYAFQYIKDVFQKTPENEKWIDYIAWRFGNIGLITPDGVKDGPHGVPSGSTFTLEVNSIAQILIANTFEDIANTEFQVQGDDGAYSTDNPEGLKKHFGEFGLTVNDEKSYISKEYCIYLQNLYSINHIKDGMIHGIYPTYRALGKICFQERFDDFKEYELEGSDFYAIRTISILENCCHHPLFEDFVRYILSLDKYGLKFSKNGLANYVKMIGDNSGRGEMLNHQYGDDLTGFNNFKTVKMIKKLSNSG